MPLRPEYMQYGPNVIGGTGGSGSRVVARIVRQQGMYIGSNRNDAEDTLDLRLTKWVGGGAGLAHWPLPPPSVVAIATPALHHGLARHLAGSGLDTCPRPWGWKKPRTMYLLPLLHQEFPSIRFLHLVRDGRDMAYSSNQAQLEQIADHLLEPHERDLPAPIRSITLWNRINTRVADYGESEMGERYLRVRFEDLCRDPIPTIEQVVSFFGLDGRIDDQTVAEVRPPTSIGRWKSRADRDRIEAEMQAAGGSGLRRFGYLDS